MKTLMRCLYCGRKPTDCERNSCLPDEVKMELARWIKLHGVRWRFVLREHWFRDGDELRYLRNAIGPSGITHIKTDDQLSAVNLLRPRTTT